MRQRERAPGKARLEVPRGADPDPEPPDSKAARLAWLERTLEEVSSLLAPLSDREPAPPPGGAEHEGCGTRLPRSTSLGRHRLGRRRGSGRRRSGHFRQGCARAGGPRRGAAQLPGKQRAAEREEQE